MHESDAGQMDADTADVADGVASGSGSNIEPEDSAAPGPGYGDGGDPILPTALCGVNPVPGCVVSQQRSVFVSAGVDESGEGTRASPVKTIAEGVALARELDMKRIVVCNGVYQEKVTLTVDDSGRSLVGGYNCDSWLYNPDGETLVRPEETGHALEIHGTSDRVTVSNITFDAMAAVDEGASSVAAFVKLASDVRLKDVQLITHDSGDGESGTLVEFVAGSDWPADNGLDGKPSGGHVYANAFPRPDVGGAQTSVECPSNESTTGGRGGDHPYLSIGGAVPGAPGLPAETGGNGGISSSPQTVESGCDSIGANDRCNCVPVSGADGMAGDPGAAGQGATSHGSVGKQGWNPSTGGWGEVGRPGGGGGGGDGAWQNAAEIDHYGGWVGGGGGGAGGCGGNRGTPGRSGGSSIALVIIDSTVSLERCTLTAGDAGDGGAGAHGQLGQPGGSGGAAPAIIGSGINSYPCEGGYGGDGGSGGPGGGGAGGISGGIVWTGDFEPTVDEDTSFGLGVGGIGGLGGSEGVNDGIDGIAVEVFEAPAG